MSNFKVETTIVAAAIQTGVNKHTGFAMVHSLPRPARHHHIIRGLAGLGLDWEHSHKQGFLTSTGQFVGRVEARNIALASGQLKETPHPTELFSEDLW